MTWLPKSVVCLRYYDRSRFRSDLLASSGLALQVFPASIAIAIATGLPPASGVSCAAIATVVASAFGDSKVRISAPGVVLLAATSTILMRDGVLGLSLATLFAGLVLAFFGATGLGRAIQLLPRPVPVGFSTGISILVVTKELPDLFGSGSQSLASEAGWGLLSTLRDLTQVEVAAVILGISSLAVIVVSKRRSRHIPAGLVTMAVGALLVKLAHLPVRTVGELAVANPTMLHLHLAQALGTGSLRRVLSQALAIAVLVAVESVQAVDLASRHTGEHADPNGELVVQAGVNLATGFAGGLPVCGVSSYSSENALLGAQTPLAGILQSVLLVGLLFLFAPFLPLVPLTVISALIVSSVCMMTHWGELAQAIKPGAVEVGAWLATSALTIVDLPFGITVGLLIGMFLYIRGQKTVRLGAPR